MSNIWLAFLTGITTGGISCMAVQGGLLTSSIAIKNEKNIAKNSNLKTIILFLLAKLIAYTFLGFLLGLLGSLLVLSLKIQAILQLLIGIFLLGTAGNLLNIHPIFRFFALKPPKFVYRLAKNQSENSGLLAPIILGLLTILIPCGVTQSMMMVALGTGNPIASSAIMFAFTLGTSPTFFVLGAATIKLLQKKAFSYVAASFIFVFGVIQINNAIGLFGSPHTLSNYWAVITGKDKLVQNVKSANTISGNQEATIIVSNRGYASDVTTLKAGIPVKLKLITNNVFSCARAFTIPSLNISKILPETGEEEIEFTPQKPGRFAYSCSMGMYTGSFNIVE